MRRQLRGIGSQVKQPQFLKLPRVKISGGASPRWIVQTLEGQDTLARIGGVIVFARDTRVYYKTAFGKGSGKQPPDCTASR